jgi:Flp pilus assembly protein TadG
VIPERRVRRANRPAVPRLAVRPPVIRRQADAGSATVELAVSLPALVLMLFAALTAIMAVRTQLECVDAAREAARSAARGESGTAAGARVAPDGASVDVSVGSDTVRTTVSVRLNPLGGRLPGFDITATAVAAMEPGGAGD